MAIFTTLFFLLQHLCYNNGQQVRPHPLDPLTKAEITLTTSIIQANSTISTTDFKFIWITLKEPRKSLFLPYFLNNTQMPRDLVPRRSHTFVLDVPQEKLFEVVINLDEQKVEYWSERDDIEDLPVQEDDISDPNKDHSDFDQRYANYLDDFSRVKISQAKPGFALNGNEITWHKFNFRVGFNAREGLVIYNVNYNDGGNVRPLFYRMSIADMFINSADPQRPAEQYGLGLSSTSLDPQVECVGEVKFLDYYLHNQKGEVKKIPRVVCIREEDNGILFKHTHLSGRKVVVRNQRLALTFMSKVGQFEYAFNWYFHLDGNIEFRAILTGVLSANLTDINDIYHQHFFTLRLDCAIDGERNTVYIYDNVVGTTNINHKNPYGTAFRVNKTLLRTAEEGMANIDFKKSRAWIIQNENKINRYTNEPVAFKLVPWNSPELLLSPDSPLGNLAILDFNTWVTPYIKNQFHPFGKYLTSISVPDWVDENPNEELIDRDLVIWHNLGISFLPRVESWPVISQESCGIILKPYNFFLENPSMDVPPAGRNTYTRF